MKSLMSFILIFLIAFVAIIGVLCGKDAYAWSKEAITGMKKSLKDLDDEVEADLKKEKKAEGEED